MPLQKGNQAEEVRLEEKRAAIEGKFSLKGTLRRETCHYRRDTQAEGGQ
ncbi:hypothetical protein ACOJQI_13625 [Bacillus salacetis]